MSSKYLNVQKQPGIRKNKLTGRYLVSKRILGKQFSKSFDTVREAQHWKNTFNGKEDVTTIEEKTSTLSYVWERMQALHFPSLELSTRRIWQRRWIPLGELQAIHMEDLSSTVINNWIERKKKWYLSESYAFWPRLRHD